MEKSKEKKFSKFMIDVKKKKTIQELESETWPAT